MKQLSIIGEIKKYLARDEFDERPIEQFFTPNHPCLKFLESISGQRVLDMDHSYLDFIKLTILNSLGISTTAFNSNIGVAPEEATHIIEKLRHGQPTSELMNLISPKIKTHINYFSSKIKNNISDFKIILGEPGAGKTTFRDLIKKQIHEGKAVFIDANFSSHSHLRPLPVLKALLFDANLIKSAIDFSTNTELHHENKYHLLHYGFFKDLIVSSRKKLSEELSSEVLAIELSHAMNRWMDGRITELRNFMRLVGSKAFTPSLPKEADFARITDNIICIYNTLGLYPVWLIDEFESIVNTYNGHRSHIFDYYRTFHDSLIQNGNGACIIFSTESGYTAIKSYPALISRLKGDSTSINNTIWDLKIINKLNKDVVISALTDIYKMSIEDVSSVNDFENKLSMYWPSFEPHVETIFSSEEVPREKLRTLVMQIFDTFMLEIHEIESEIERISNSKQKNNYNELIQDELNKVLKEVSIKLAKNQQTVPIEKKNLIKANEIPDVHITEDTTSYSLLGISTKSKDRFASMNNNLMGIFTKSNHFGDFSYSEISDLPSLLKIHGRPINFFERSSINDQLKSLETLLAESKSVISFAKKYSRFRDLGGVWEEGIIAPFQYNEETYDQSNNVFVKLSKIFELSKASKYIPVHVSPPKNESSENRYKHIIIDNTHRYHINHLNAIYSLSTIREFSYAYLLQHSIFPRDEIIDKFVLDTFKGISGKDTSVSRKGIFFMKVDNLITGALSLKSLEDTKTQIV